MQAVLATAVPVTECGVVLIKSGSVPQGRVLVMPAPDTLAGEPDGVVEMATSPAEPTDTRLHPLWTQLMRLSPKNQDFMRAWLMQRTGCQCADPTCHREWVVRPVGDSMVRLCWIHDQAPEEQTLQVLARHNLAAYWTFRINVALQLPPGHAPSLAEVCWYLTLIGQINQLPEAVAREVLHRPAVNYREQTIGRLDTDDAYWPHPADQLTQLAESVVRLLVDEAPPSRYLLRPKPIHWRHAAYTRYVKSGLCVVCHQPADDPHHLIGHGQGKMGSKAHDLFTIPLCRQHHDELHRDMTGWEHRHGTQLAHLISTLDRALKEGALA